MSPEAPCPAEVRLRYGVTPEDAGLGLVPGMCASPAHDRENLGLGGRRVAVSPRWSGNTLTEHPDRREVVAQVLAAAGIEAPDADRLAADRALPDGDALIHVADSHPDDHLRRRHSRIPTPGPDLTMPVRARQDHRRATRLTTCGPQFGNWRSGLSRGRKRTWNHTN